jgi:hypothetical protein
MVFTWEMFTKPYVLKLATFLSQKWFENAPKTFVTWKLFADAIQIGPKRFYYPSFSTRVPVHTEVIIPVPKNRSIYP